MNIAIVGTGYVGLVQGACFADTGNSVICMDIDAAKVDALRRGEMPIYEPGLGELVVRNIDGGRLRFTTDLREAVEESEIIFLCLPTPQSEDGSADVSHVLAVVGQISAWINGYKIIVSKSTVPVGTVDRMRDVLRAHTAHVVDVASNPEFLKEGAAVADSLRPDRVVVGANSPKAIAMLQELYDPFVRTGKPVIVMDIRSAELTKYAANAFLATKISFMNDLALLAEHLGVDIEMVRKGIGSDPRIGPQFLFAGAGYGGSCFPKDVKALLKTADVNGHPLRILRAVDAVNEDQKIVLVSKLREHFRGGVRGLRVAIWGLAFKPQTDDMREAPSVSIIRQLIAAGMSVCAHDPVAIGRAKEILGTSVTYAQHPYEALEGADALLVVTEWNEYRRPNFERMKELLKQPVIFDGRNVYDPKEMRERGFMHYGIGRVTS